MDISKEDVFLALLPAIYTKMPKQHTGVEVAEVTEHFTKEVMSYINKASKSNMQLLAEEWDNE